MSPNASRIQPESSTFRKKRLRSIRVEKRQAVHLWNGALLKIKRLGGLPPWSSRELDR
jgi:hypothetical protein